MSNFETYFELKLINTNTEFYQKFQSQDKVIENVTFCVKIEKVLISQKKIGFKFYGHSSFLLRENGHFQRKNF